MAHPAWRSIFTAHLAEARERMRAMPDAALDVASRAYTLARQHRAVVERIDARTCIVEALVRLGRFDEAQREGLVALDAARTFGGARLVDTLYWLARAQFGHAAFADAAQALHEAQTIAVQAGDAMALSRIHQLLGNIHVKLDDFPTAERMIEQAMAYGVTAARDVSGLAFNLGDLWQARGDLHRAEALYRRGLDDVRRQGNHSGEALALCILGELLLRQRRTDDAMQSLEQAFAIAHALDATEQQLQAQLLIGETLRVRGDAAAAIARLSAALVDARRAGHRLSIVTALESLERAYRDTGQLREALDVAHERFALERQRFHDETDRQVRELAIRLDTERAKHEAEVHRIRAVELAHVNERLNKSNRALRQALEALGLRGDVAARARGAHAEPLRTVLTPRELDVLKLVAKGLTNQAIAAAMHLSAYTVRHHVTSILRKLQVTSRTQAVAVLLRERSQASPPHT